MYNNIFNNYILNKNNFQWIVVSVLKFDRLVPFSFATPMDCPKVFGGSLCQAQATFLQ